MTTIFRHRGIGGLLFAQSQVAFNDNATKLILIGLVQMLLPAETALRMTGLIALLLVTPFVLFAPLSGWAADYFPKRGVLSASLWLQLAVMVVLIVAAVGQSLALGIGGFFLLGLQSALMSPARRGMVKDLAGDSVGEVIGWMEMLCIAAILAGSLGGGQLIDGLALASGDPWSAALISFLLLAAGCVAALCAFRKVPTHPAANRVPFSRSAVFGHLDLLKSLRRDRAVWRAALGDSVFYLAGGVLMLTLSQAGRELFPDGVGTARVTGIMLAVMGAGIAVGSIVAARASRHRIIMGLVPLAALGLSGVLFILAMLTPGGAAFLTSLFVLGLCGGLYLVPLGAFLVDRAPEGERGKILAASSMLSSIAGVAAVGIHALACSVFGLDLKGQLALLGAGFFVTALFATQMLSQDVLRVIALVLARVRYAVTSKGVGNLPPTGGALIVCNHVSYVDTLILSLAAPRPIRFLSYAEFFKRPVLGKILRIAGAIPVSSTKARDAIVRAAECINQGELVCIFPEGQLTRTGCLMEIKSGFELIARRAKCPVVVAHLDGLWGSIYSFEGGRYFTKWPRGWRRSATVSFSDPLANEAATAPRVREILLALGEDAFRSRSGTDSLASRLIRALKVRPFRICVSEPSASRKHLRAGPLLATAWTLARGWRDLPELRVGVILPPGLAGTITNLALILAGKVPVNLNPNRRGRAAGHSHRAADHAHVSARLHQARFPRRFWHIAAHRHRRGTAHRRNRRRRAGTLWV